MTRGSAEVSIPGSYPGGRGVRFPPPLPYDMKIIHTNSKIELAKRFYAPVEIYDDCPCCGTEVIEDFDDHYLSYPVTNKPFKVYLYCSGCSESWSHEVMLKIRLEKV